MADSETVLDSVIVCHYLISSADSFEAVWDCLDRNGRFCNSNSSLFLLKLVLTSLPDQLFYSNASNVAELIEKTIELSIEKNDNAEIIDNDDHKSLPNTIKQILDLDYDTKKQMYNSLIESIDELCNKYDFIDIDSNNASSIFTKSVKFIIFKVNNDFAGFSITDNLIVDIKKSKYADLNLLDWIKGYYEPLKFLNGFDCSYTLMDYDHILSIDDKVDIILSKIKDTNTSHTILINDILIPHFNYLGTESWNSLNDWLLKFCEQCTSTTADFKFLIHLLRHDQFLNSINSLETSLKERFVSLILSIIYLCPSTTLQILVYSKEILTLLKSLNLKEGDDNLKVLSELTKYSKLKDLSSKISASHSTIDLMLETVNLAEILYSNNISFVDIINLENSSKDAQYIELIKYINNEVNIESNDKKWLLFLTSLFTTLKKTSIFNKIPIEEVSKLILEKLLDLKQYSVIEIIFLKNFNYVSDSELQNLFIKYSWKLYSKATNCDQNIGYLKDCNNCTKLINKDSKNFKQITHLLEANKQLLEWKFYFKQGEPLQPRNLLDINDPFIIIRRILELNDNAYSFVGDLYYLLTLLIDGLDINEKDPLFKFKSLNFDDVSNLLVIKLKLICLEYSSITDYTYSYDFSINLLDLAVEQKYNVEGLYALISENWFLFFQLSKNEYDVNDLKITESELLDQKLSILSKLLLITPTDFNTNVLEQWQFLNSHKEQQQEEKSYQPQSRNYSNLEFDKSSSLGNVQDRLQRSLKSSAEGLLNTNSSDIGKNIVGWIIGAN